MDLGLFYGLMSQLVEMRLAILRFTIETSSCLTEETMWSFVYFARTLESVRPNIFCSVIRFSFETKPLKVLGRALLSIDFNLSGYRSHIIMIIMICRPTLHATTPT